MAAATVALAGVTAGAAAASSTSAAPPIARASAIKALPAVAAFHPSFGPGLTARPAGAPNSATPTHLAVQVKPGQQAGTASPLAIPQSGGQQSGAPQSGGQQSAPQSGGQHSTTAKQKAAPQHSAAAPQQAAGAQQAAAAQQAAPPPPPKPYRIYDSVTPSSIPSGQTAAVYSTGSYAAQPSQVGGFSRVLWIDTTGGNPNASVLDVEPGDATPAQAASWVQQRLTANPHAIARVYTMISQWPDVKAAIGGLPQWMQSHVRYWIADPTGVDHMVPGADATQWYWGSNYDISTAQPGF